MFFNVVNSVLVPHIFKKDGLLYSSGSADAELFDFGDRGDAYLTSVIGFNYFPEI